MKGFFLGCCIVVLGLSIFGLAEAATVENEIHVKASTGGTSKTEVFVETVVDGQVVEHVEERKVEESGNPIEMEVRAKYENGETDVEVLNETETEAQGETEEAPREVESEEEPKSFLTVIVEFFRSILDTLFFA